MPPLQAALRLVCSPLSINAASACLCRSFPTPIGARASDSYRSLCTRLPPNVMLLNWKTPHPPPPVRSHLPVDALAHLTLPLLEGLTFAPMINSLLLPVLPPLLDDVTMSAAYRTLQWNASSLMVEHWHSLSPVSRLLHLSPLTVPSSIHGARKVHGWPHPSNAGPKALPGRLSLLVRPIAL